MPNEAARENEQRRDHVTAALVQRGPADSEQDCERNGERHGKHRHVQTERLTLEEAVAEETQPERHSHQYDPEPRLATHRRLFNHAPIYEEPL